MTRPQPDRGPRETEEQEKSKLRRAWEFITSGLPSQITVTPTLAITVSFSVAVTFAISAYAFITLVFQDTGWEVAQTQASTSYTVLMSQDVVVEESLEVKKDLRVQEDIQILGSVLDMAGSSCGAEGLAPANVVRLCYEQADQRLKASASGGDYVDLMGASIMSGASAGETGPEGPPGPAGSDGLNCWDLNGDGTPDLREDANRDGQINVLDCQGLQGPPGPPGADGLGCWDLNGNGFRERSEDLNGDGILDAQDCQPSQVTMRGIADLPIRLPCFQLQLSADILNASSGDDRLISVQLTARDRWRPVYAIVRPPEVLICDDNGSGGPVDYQIGVVTTP